jgi:hypothetical protein
MRARIVLGKSAPREPETDPSPQRVGLRKVRPVVNTPRLASEGSGSCHEASGDRACAELERSAVLAQRKQSELLQGTGDQRQSRSVALDAECLRADTPQYFPGFRYRNGYLLKRRSSWKRLTAARALAADGSRCPASEDQRFGQ